jgi:hypothetical protein
VATEWRVLLFRFPHGERRYSGGGTDYGDRRDYPTSGRAVAYQFGLVFL